MVVASYCSIGMLVTPRPAALLMILLMAEHAAEPPGCASPWYTQDPVGTYVL